MPIGIFLARPGIDPEPFVGRVGPRRHASLVHGPFRITLIAKTKDRPELLDITANGVSVRSPQNRNFNTYLYVTVDGVEWQVYSQFYSHNRKRPFPGPADHWRSHGCFWPK